MPRVAVGSLVTPSTRLTAARPPSFRYGDAASSPEAALLSQEHRQEAASALNAAILAAQHQQSESRLPMMLRMLQWAQDELALRHAVTFPRIDDLAEAVPVLAAREAAD